MTYFTEHDKKIVRELAARYREIAESEQTKRSIQLAYNTNDLKGGRPFVHIDELPWVELNGEGELTRQCEDDFAAGLEDYFRKSLYRWNHFRTNDIFPNAFYFEKAYEVQGWILQEKAKILETEQGNNIVSHKYEDQLPDEASLEKIRPMKVIAHPEQDAQRLEKATELLGGALEAKLNGRAYIYLPPWDSLVRFHTVENTYIDMVDRPEFIHAMMQRYVNVHTDMLEQQEKLGLLGDIRYGDTLHCTAPFVSEFEKTEPGQPNKMKNMWLRCMAQSLGSCSPAMYNEFEIEHMKELIERFGLIYYGCCEPLERVIPYLRKLPNLRKIGVSPFADLEMSAEQIRGDYVLSRKPNPSNMSGDFNEEVVRKEIEETVRVCEKYGCSYDYVLKDISTVGHDPSRLSRWAKIVNGVLDAQYGR